MMKEGLEKEKEDVEEARARDETMFFLILIKIKIIRSCGVM